MHDQRYSRDGAGLAGATSDPRLHIWLEDLDMQALNDEATRLRLRASMEGAAIDFTLEHTKPPQAARHRGLQPEGGRGSPGQLLLLNPASGDAGHAHAGQGAH